MSTIIPSTKLRIVSVHKLNDMTCLRRYFWRRVLNLQSCVLNMNFWYGGVLGAGFEAMLSGKNWRKAIQSEDKKRLTGDLANGLADELNLQRKLIEVILEGAQHQPAVREMKLVKSQIQFSVKLECGIKFCGTEDGEGTVRGQPKLFEIKTASKVTKSYIDSLRLDKQINSYAWSRKKRKEKFLGECEYCIFKKPQKRIKRGQTLGEFVDEIRGDIVERPDMYYEWHALTLGRSTIEDTGRDISRLAEILADIYGSLTTSELLNPGMWPKQESKCADYKGCEFLPLCTNINRWRVFLRMYRQRDMLYEEEQDELYQPKRVKGKRKEHK